VPYKDTEKARAYQAAWQRKKKGHKERPRFDVSREDADPRACWWRFHTTNPCRNVARWVTVTTATRWCDKHKNELDWVVDVVRIPEETPGHGSTPKVSPDPPDDPPPRTPPRPLPTFDV
tara:strand:- start:32213 stop:32569 length:357 start_codon:yes stop_codon:yes gene_type:complete